MAQDKQEQEAKRAVSPITRRVDAEKALKAMDGSLWRLLCTDDKERDTVKITVVARPDGYLAIGNRMWETEAVYVAFASGETVMDALLALARKWYHRDAWKKDKPKEG